MKVNFVDRQRQFIQKRSSISGALIDDQINTKQETILPQEQTNCSKGLLIEAEITGSSKGPAPAQWQSLYHFCR